MAGGGHPVVRVAIVWSNDWAMRRSKYGVVDANLEFDTASGGQTISAPDAALFTDIMFRCRGGYQGVVESLIRSDSRGDMSDAELNRCVHAVTEDDVRHGYEDFFSERGTATGALFRKLRRAACGDFYGG